MPLTSSASFLVCRARALFQMPFIEQFQLAVLDLIWLCSRFLIEYLTKSVLGGRQRLGGWGGRTLTEMTFLTAIFEYFVSFLEQ